MHKRLPELVSSLARRPWARSERAVVWQGFLGRFLIAIEPIIVASVFAAMVGALIRLARPDAPAILLGPIFGLGALAFAVYAVVLMVGPTRALMETFSPIYIVDGYVRYRKPDLHSEPDSNGYVAVLNEERQLLCEWPLRGKRDTLDRSIPAMVQFTKWGGMLKIDGENTGALPDRLPALGIGATLPRS